MSLPVQEYFGLFPVKILRGLARGAWWSVYPYSAYWRRGGTDPAIDNVLQRYAALPGMVCWDIGAHYGIYSVGLARAVGRAGRVEAFEPDPVSRRRLLWHRWLNRLDHLYVHPVAASAVSDTARLYQYSGFGDTTSHLPYSSEQIEHVPYREITTVALDQWVETGRILSPQFIKIDVEGHAGPALEGMRHTLASARPIVLLAIHTEEEHGAARSVLSQLGYSLSPLPGNDAADVLATHFGELLCLPPSDPVRTTPTAHSTSRQ